MKWSLTLLRPRKLYSVVLIQKSIVYPAAMDTIEQLTFAKILGIFVHCGFTCDNHADFILSVCSQRVTLSKLLRDRGLQLPRLYIICQSLVVSRILYALPAWGGLLSAELKGLINAFLRCLYNVHNYIWFYALYY